MYCTASDLLVKDVLLGPGDTLDEWVARASEEMDSYLGARYVIPIEPIASLGSPSAQDLRILKQINIKLASGRFYLAHSSNEEDDRLHAYGRYLVNEAINALIAIRDETFSLSSLDTIVTDLPAPERRMPGPVGGDSVSYVDAFPYSPSPCKHG